MISLCYFWTYLFMALPCAKEPFWVIWNYLKYLYMLLHCVFIQGFIYQLPDISKFSLEIFCWDSYR